MHCSSCASQAEPRANRPAKNTDEIMCRIAAMPPQLPRRLCRSPRLSEFLDGSRGQCAPQATRYPERQSGRCLNPHAGVHTLCLRSLGRNHKLKGRENSELRDALTRLRRAIRSLNSLHNQLSESHKATCPPGAVACWRLLWKIPAGTRRMARSSFTMKGSAQLVFVGLRGYSCKLLQGYRMPADQSPGWCISQH